MNWATIAPESRLYKGKDLFRWDVSPGLDHHCGICATPLHNSRARSTCIGKHVEPCYRFHQQLHFIGRSHECFGCNHSDEMHHNRHKEILILIRKINGLDEVQNPGQTRTESPSLGRSRQDSPQSSVTSTTAASEVSSEYGEDVGIKMTRSERKKAKKLGQGLGSSATKKQKVEAFSKEDTDFVSEAIHLTIHETKGGWHDTYIYHNKQPELGNSIREVEEIEDTIDRAATLSVKAPSTPTHFMTPRQRRNLKKFSITAKHQSYRGGSRKFIANGSSNDAFGGLDPQIFFRLNIEASPSKNSVARKELFVKLVTAIKNDLAILAQEDAESEMRAEGFWRWAGKSAWQAIAERREGLDWATGQKIGTPQKDAKYPYPESDDDDDVAAADEVIEEGHPIAKLPDDDPPGDSSLDFSVKGEYAFFGKENVKEVKQAWAVVTTGKHAARKKRTEGGRAFVSKSVGGVATLRITSS